MKRNPATNRAIWGCVDLEESVYTGQTNQLIIDNSPALCKNKKFLKCWVWELSTPFAIEIHLTPCVADLRLTAIVTFWPPVHFPWRLSCFSSLSLSLGSGGGPTEPSSLHLSLSTLGGGGAVWWMGRGLLERKVYIRLKPSWDRDFWLPQPLGYEQGVLKSRAWVIGQ